MGVACWVHKATIHTQFVKCLLLFHCNNSFSQRLNVHCVSRNIGITPTEYHP
jgi:hypothetical protein